MKNGLVSPGLGKPDPRPGVLRDAIVFCTTGSYWLICCYHSADWLDMVGTTFLTQKMAGSYLMLTCHEIIKITLGGWGVGVDGRHN